MIKEKRKNIRRLLQFDAWIGIEKTAPLRGCMVADISDTGAKLTVANPQDLPESFMLLLEGRGRVGRRCSVVWRTKTQVGVHFEK